MPPSQLETTNIKLRSGIVTADWVSYRVPSVKDVINATENMCIYDDERRRRAIDALKYILEPGHSWEDDDGCRITKPRHNGSATTYQYCIQQNIHVTRTTGLPVRECIADAACLLVVWDAYDHSGSNHNECLHKMTTVFILVTEVRSNKRQKKFAKPTPIMQQARTCGFSDELIFYVRGHNGWHDRNKSEWLSIKEFLEGTKQGHDLLVAAGVEVGGYELDHYMSKNLGGPDWIENAYILPKNGINQHFSEKFSKEKMKYCGIAQHEMWLKKIGVLN